MHHTGKLMMITGALLFLLGIIIRGGAKYFRWFGHLPGDIAIERGNFRFYAPLASMLLVSVVATLLLWFIRKLFF